MNAARRIRPPELAGFISHIRMHGACVVFAPVSYDNLEGPVMDGIGRVVYQQPQVVNKIKRKESKEGNRQPPQQEQRRQRRNEERLIDEYA